MTDNILIDLEKGEVNEVERALENNKAEEAVCCMDEIEIPEFKNELKQKISYPEVKLREPFSGFQVAKEDCVKPVSIWKDVNELPYNYAKVILKIKAGTHYYLEAFFKEGKFYGQDLRDFENLPIRKEAIWKWCYKNEPLKLLEQMQKDIEELKKK